MVSPWASPVGLLDVLVFHLAAISSQRTVSAGVDLALGLLLLAVGALVATDHTPSRACSRPDFTALTNAL